MVPAEHAVDMVPQLGILRHTFNWPCEGALSKVTIKLF